MNYRAQTNKKTGIGRSKNKEDESETFEQLAMDNTAYCNQQLEVKHSYKDSESREENRIANKEESFNTKENTLQKYDYAFNLGKAKTPNALKCASIVTTKHLQDNELGTEVENIDIHKTNYDIYQEKAKYCNDTYNHIEQNHDKFTVAAYKVERPTNSIEMVAGTYSHIGDKTRAVSAFHENDAGDMYDHLKKEVTPDLIKEVDFCSKQSDVYAKVSGNNEIYNSTIAQNAKHVEDNTYSRLTK